MECPRGWLLAVNDDGYIVPFFVKVRSTDIYYSSSESSKYNEDYYDITGGTGADITIIAPGSTYEYSANGWFMRVNEDESFVGTAIVHFDKTEMTYVADSSTFPQHYTFTLKLPFLMVDDDFKHVDIMQRVDSPDLICINENITFGPSLTSSDDSSIEKGDSAIQQITVDVYQTNTRFSYSEDGTIIPLEWTSTSLSNAEFKSSYLVVTLTGHVYVGKLSHAGQNVGSSWNGTSAEDSDVYTKEVIDAKLDSLYNQVTNDIDAARTVARNIVDIVNEDEDADILYDEGIIGNIDESYDENGEKK